jgi:23S rRNA (cytosine1962-C5)-methyltransferase
VHASENGFPILGDVLYGGTPASRVYLHAAEIEFKHPATGQRLLLKAPVDFDRDPRLAYRAALLDPKLTNAYRVIHGASDGWPGWYVHRLGQYILSESQQPLTGPQRDELSRLMHLFSALGAYHKVSPRRKTTSPAAASPQLVMGASAPPRLLVAENGLQFELSFREGGSPGLFLDQRDNRYRLLQRHIAAEFEIGQPTHPVDLASGKPNSPWEVLNAFAYTCGFSVCASKAGAQTVSLDLSKKYLDWGRRNFSLNQLEPNQHEFICGEVFDWLRRFRKKGRRFDVILLDPPTFSQSKESGVFRAEKDFGKLVSAALPLLKPGGLVFASCNAATLKPEGFLAILSQPFQSAGLEVVQKQYFPQPPDFPISRSEPGYLKTAWLQVGIRQR